MICILFLYFFFFSSRRRHTRLQGDWSSDVCSSDLGVSNAIVDPDLFERFRLVITEEAFLLIEGQVQNSDGVVLIKARDIKPLVHRSEERRVGKECRSRWSPYH